ncbi:hypothetical protein MTO96_011703 [Rhipicephalus appendiculatus]
MLTSSSRKSLRGGAISLSALLKARVRTSQGLSIEILRYQVSCSSYKSHVLVFTCIVLQSYCLYYMPAMRRMRAHDIRKVTKTGIMKRKDGT